LILGQLLIMQVSGRHLTD